MPDLATIAGNSVQLMTKTEEYAGNFYALVITASLQTEEGTLSASYELVRLQVKKINLF